MPAPASPIDIKQPRYGSSSPRALSSNLTSALQGAGRVQHASQSAGAQGKSAHDPARLGATPQSFGNGLSASQRAAGAVPISSKNHGRRESLAGSLMAGMSWGGVSVGSWIRDDIMMTGTSPFTMQSPSFHSSSYLPKMEANFMRDFECCGQVLDSLHELLQHYEQSHAQMTTTTTTTTTTMAAQQPAGAGRASNASSQQASTLTAAQQQSVNANPQLNRQLGSVSGMNALPSFQHRRSSLDMPARPQMQDMDPLDDMEMDDETPSPAAHQHLQAFGGQNNAVPPVNMNLANAMHSHNRNSVSPTSPAVSKGFPLQHNPTVSSVNTPALSTGSMHQQTKSSPEPSVPGTPAEYDPDFIGNLQKGDKGMTAGTGAGNPQLVQNGTDWNNLNFFNGNDMLDLCIDEPAKRLFSRTGGFCNQLPQFGEDGDVAARTRMQQQQGFAGNQFSLPVDESKQYKCPVIGCEKAYKNNNGLKYHRQHGHQNQQLQQNPDGTFSIVDPITSIPYPGTVGMEKEKPYRCEVCGKRYKNLNGLKYHRAHSPPCNPELQMGGGAPMSAQPMNVNVAGAGL